MKKLLGRVARAIGYLFLLAFVGVCGLVTLGNAPERGERNRQARADAVVLIAALEEFRSAAGAYPAALGELVPRLVSEIPARAGGGSFRYERHGEEREFRLGYPDAPMGTLPNDGYHSYDSASQAWTFEVL